MDTETISLFDYFSKILVNPIPIIFVSNSTCIYQDSTVFIQTCVPVTIAFYRAQFMYINASMSGFFFLQMTRVIKSVFMHLHCR